MTSRSNIEIEIRVGGKTKWVSAKKLMTYLLEDETPELFNKFWESYPRKEAKSKAEKIWKKLTKKEKDLIFQALPTHLKNWKGKDRSFIPMPTSWLNQKRFEDEIIIEEDPADEVAAADLLIKRQQRKQREYFDKDRGKASPKEIKDILGKHLNKRRPTE